MTLPSPPGEWAGVYSKRDSSHFSRGRELKFALVELPRESDVVQKYSVEFSPRFRHPFYGWLGLRPALAQHTEAEHATLKRWATNRFVIVELGVAEGVSALALREAMAENGTLYLIDPFHLSRIPALNFMKRVARRAVASCRRGNVVWIPKFSQGAVPGWNISIDLLFYRRRSLRFRRRRDWNDWSRFVKVGGVVIFHDARTFADGWVHPEYGPWKLVERLFRDGSTPNWKIVDEAHSMVVLERLQ